MSSRHRKIHHAQNLSALAEQSSSSPFAMDPGALEFPKGTYSLIHKLRRAYRDKRLVMAAIQAEYPGCVIGRQRLSPKFWTFEVQLPPGSSAPTVEMPPEVTPEAKKIVNQSPGMAQGSIWCSGCACPVMVPSGATHYPEHKAMGSVLLCKKAGKPLPVKKEK